MILKIENGQVSVHCCVCDRWQILDRETYYLDEEVRCLKDDEGDGHILGYKKDLDLVAQKFGEMLVSPSITRIEHVENFHKKFDIEK